MLTLVEMAQCLGVHPETLRRYYRRGRVRGYKLGHNILRFDAAEVKADLREKELSR